MQLALLALASMAAAAETLVDPLLEENDAPGLDRISDSKSLCIHDACEYVALTDQAGRYQLENHVRANPDIYGDNTTTVIRFVTNKRDFKYATHSKKSQQELKQMVEENLHATVSEWPIIGRYQTLRNIATQYLVKLTLGKLSLD